MRLNIHDQFIVGVVRPSGGWSKGRPIAYIEEGDKCVLLFDLLIPNDLYDEQLVRYVRGKFRAFAQPSKRIEVLQGTPAHERNLAMRRRGVAQLYALASVQR